MLNHGKKFIPRKDRITLSLLVCIQADKNCLHPQPKFLNIRNDKGILSQS